MLFTNRKRQINTRKVIFTIVRKDGSKFICEITGKVRQKKFLFFKYWSVEYATPDKIVYDWGQKGFLKIDSRQFINVDQIDSITFKTEPHVIEV